MTPEAFQAQIKAWHQARRAAKRVAKAEGQRRGRLLSADRPRVLAVTGGRCHICGGTIDGQRWEADHVMAFSRGGADSWQNFLPAHKTCNQYRWDYLPEEFEMILKLGVWMRGQIERGTPVGRAAAPAFLAHRRQTAARTKRPTARPKRA